MKSVKLLLLLILTLSVAVPAFAKEPILDPLPDNLWQPDVRYEYRDYDHPFLEEVLLERLVGKVSF